MLPFFLVGGMAFREYVHPFSVELFWLFTFGYVFSMTFLSPDMDLSQSVSYRNWGVFRLFWWPYAKIFSHRGISHSFFFGTLTRVLYLGVVFSPFGVFLCHFYPKVCEALGKWFVESPERILALYLGLFVPNALHVLLDRWRGG